MPTAQASSQPTPNIDLLAEAPTLAFGARDPHVKTLQKALKELGFFSHGCDGTFGPKTKDAVGRFQLAHGLLKSAEEKGYGVFGPKTKAAMISGLGQTAEALSPREQELTHIIQQLRTDVQTTLEAQGQDIARIKSELDIGRLEVALSSLRDTHAQSMPLMHQLQILADAATPDQATMGRVETHSSAIIHIQTHLLQLRDLALKLEDQVGRRLHLSQSDPRRLTDSCRRFFDNLISLDNNWKSAIASFCKALSQQDQRIFSDKHLRSTFTIVDFEALQHCGKKGFLPAEFPELQGQYAAMQLKSDPHGLQDVLQSIIFMAAQYPEIAQEELQRILGGAYVTIDQGLLNQFALDLSSLFHTAGLDCTVVPDGNPNSIRHIPSSYAPMPYVMGVDRPGNPAPKAEDLEHTIFFSGLSFTDSQGSRYLFASRPPAIRISQDHA